MKDLLPEGLSYVTGSARISFNGGTETEAEPEVSGQTLTWNLSAIPEAVSYTHLYLEDCWVDWHGFLQDAYGVLQ